MKILFKYATAALLLAGAAACSQPSERASIIDENIAVAEKQIGMLADSSETGGVIRIPSTWKNGRIDYVPVDDWVSGFFAGTLWYMYELTGDEAWAARARKHTEILDSVQYLQWHHDVGFMIYDSYGNGLRLKNVPGYEGVIVQTAKSLATRFRPVPGVIQSWDADRGWQGERGWQCPVIIDNMMNLELMFKATEFSGDSTYYNIAVKHADRTMKEHFRDDYSCYHVVDYDLTTGGVRGRCTAQGYADDSAWARGQAWAVYGYTTCYRYTVTNATSTMRGRWPVSCSTTRTCPPIWFPTGTTTHRTSRMSRATSRRRPSSPRRSTKCTPIRVTNCISKRPTGSSNRFRRRPTALRWAATAAFC